MTNPDRPTSVVSQLPFVRFGGQRAAQFLAEALEARAASPNTPERRAARRARVLAHPWAAQRLGQIIGANPARWNGYMPEGRDPHTARESNGRHHPLDSQTWRSNTLAPYLALRQLLADVAAFESDQQQGNASVVQG